MSKKLRKRFIFTAMVSVTLVLLLIVGTINVINYTDLIKEADETIEFLSSVSKGQDNPVPPPEKDDRSSDRRREIGGRDPFAPDFLAESRFFTTEISADGTVKVKNMDNILSVDEKKATQYTAEILKLGKSKGFLDSFRYRVTENGSEKTAFFLDCTRNLHTQRSFLVTSILISVGALIMISVLLTLLSKRIIRPLTDSYEKQKRFITDAGHELRTPLAVIEADTEVLEMEHGSSEWTEDIRTQVSRLGTLTDELIYLSKIEEGEKTVKTEFPVSEVCEEVLASFESLARTAEKEMIKNVESGIYYNGDEKAVRQMISIMTDNAIKHSDKGSVVSVGLSRKGKGIEIRTENLASDMSKDDIRHIFDRFYRGDSSRSTKGYGIGTSVAKAIAEAHGGEISAVLEGKRLIITAYLA